MSAEHRATWAVLWLALAVACTQPSLPAPELHRVVPAEVQQSLGAQGYLEGTALFAELEDAFWGSSPATLDAAFRVRVGGVELSAGAVTQVSSSRLEVRFPAGLPLGLHDVTVTTPEGRSATLPAALAVVEVSAPVLTLEDAPDGSGQPVGPRQLEPGGPALEVHAILRGDGGRFLQQVPSAWTLTEDVGSLTPSSDGGSATLRPLRAGTARVLARPLDGKPEAQTGELRVAPVRFLAIASLPLRGEAGECVGPLLLVTRDGAGNSAPVAQDTEVTLGTQPAGVTFHPDANCSAAATAAVTLAPGETQGSVWLRAGAPGTFTLQASTAWEGSATQPFEVGPPTARMLAFSTLGVQTSGRPFSVALTALDARGQVVSGFSGAASLTLVGGGTLTCVSGCTAGLSTGPFSGGRWSGTVRVTGAPGDGRLLQASAGAVTGTSNAFSLLASRTPPLARPRAVQPAVRAGVAMTFDASASTDRESPASELEYSWEFGASTPESWTPWSTSPTASFTYTTANYRIVRLAVRDPDGDVGYSALVVVATDSSNEVCVVDAPSAATDDGALNCTSARGLDGRLSLAEALRLNRSRAGYKAILIAPGLTVSGPASFTLANDFWLMGSGGSVLSGVSFTVPANRYLVLGSLAYRGPSASVTVQAGGTSALETVELEDGAAVTSAGVLYVYHSRLSGCTGGACVTMTGTASTLHAWASAIVDSTLGLHASGCASGGVDAVGMVFARNTTGVRIDDACTASRLVSVTFDGNGTGLDLRASTGNDLRNALFTRNTSAATCTGASFVRSGALLSWNNGGDGCLPAGGISLRVDPHYLSPSEDDFRLESWSPAVNAGTPAGFDTNDAAPGDYTGSAPDLGGRETW